MADAPKCQWINLQDACAAFVRAESGVQGSHHIRPLHWYVACRLVIEGGFFPHEIKPHTPFRVEDGRKAGEITDFIRNYASAMARLTGRRELRNDVTGVQTCALPI